MAFQARKNFYVPDFQVFSTNILRISPQSGPGPEKQTGTGGRCCSGMNTNPDDRQDRLNEHIFQVLRLQSAGTAEEIAFTIAELQGISTEESNAEMIQAVKERAEKLVEDGKLEEVRSRHASKRYQLPEGSHSRA